MPSLSGGRKKNSFRQILLLLILLDLGLILANTYLLCIHWYHLEISIPLGGILLVTIIGLISLLLIFFKWIYRPICKIEVALHIFEEYGENFSIKMDRYNESYPIANSLNHIHARLRESIDREYIAHMKQKDAEIQALQNQINPHFLYNTLDAIRGLALINDDEPVANMTEALSAFFRYSIGNKGHIVTLREELENIKSYLLIQNNRFKNKFTFQLQLVDCPENVLDCLIPKLLLQPIIENSVYHGIEPKVGPGTIVMRIFITDTSLFINIQDDGVGMDRETLDTIRKQLQQSNTSPDGSGIALRNINQRIKLNYGEHYGVTVASTKGVGSETELELPIILKTDAL